MRSKRIPVPVVVGCLALLLSTALWGQQAPSQDLDELKREIEALKQGQQAIKQQLEEIKKLLAVRRPQPAPQPKEFVLDVSGQPFMGDEKARLAMIEFSDYQCPYCGRHVRETVPQIKKNYVSTGKLKYIFSDLPLESIHKNAFKAAEAAGCAGDQGKFWEMHDRLFANQRALSPPELRSHAEALGLDLARFDACLEEGTHEANVRKELAAARGAGLTSTPSFGLGFPDPKDPNKVKVVRVMKGAQPYTSFQAALDTLLAEINKEEPKAR